MPQIMKVFILLTCFGTFLTCNSGFHIKLIFYVLLKIMNILHEGGGGQTFFSPVRGGIKHFFSTFLESPQFKVFLFIAMPLRSYDQVIQKIFFFSRIFF